MSVKKKECRHFIGILWRQNNENGTLHFLPHAFKDHLASNTAKDSLSTGFVQSQKKIKD